MIVEMTSNLFAKSRHYGVLLPDGGETVELPDAAAEELIAAKHAKAYVPEGSEPVEDAPEKPAEVATEVVPETAAVEAPENAAEPKRGPGRPRKAAE